MFVAIRYVGLDMKTGRNLIQQKEKGDVMHYYAHDQEKNDQGESNLYVVSNYNTYLYGGTWLNMDYELQQGNQLDYLFFESSKALKPSELH